MEFSVKREGDKAVVKIIGEIHTPEVKEFGRVLEDNLQNSKGPFVIDASELSYMNSAAVGVIAAIQRKLKESGRDALIIRHPLPAILRLLRVTRLDTVLNVVEKRH